MPRVKKRKKAKCAICIYIFESFSYLVVQLALWYFVPSMLSKRAVLAVFPSFGTQSALAEALPVKQSGVAAFRA